MHPKIFYHGGKFYIVYFFLTELVTFRFPQAIKLSITQTFLHFNIHSNILVDYHYKNLASVRFLLLLLFVFEKRFICFIKKYIVILWNVIIKQYYCDEKLYSSSVSHDPSKIILICWFLLWNPWYSVFFYSLIKFEVRPLFEIDFFATLYMTTFFPQYNASFMNKRIHLFKG